MCGFTGFRQTASTDPVSPMERLKIMGDSIRHRGPDAEGVWFSDTTGVGLSHRRLSIQDVSVSGAQPMVSGSGRYVIAFNGEIYNFVPLREKLMETGYSFRGHSDTEVMLACFEQWGIRGAIDKFEGMFAFALIDLELNLLHLARDRAGEKPLYYGWNRHNTLLFGSELKALRKHPDFIDTIDRNAVALLLRHNYIPAPYSIYQSIKKLEPGCYLSVPLDTKSDEAVITRYWNISLYYKDCGKQADIRDYRNELESLLKRSIRQQMISDVPLGAFLSGGVDSSTIAALMQLQSTSPVKTFCIGFDEKQYNEAEYAKKIASHLGTEHTELYITARDSIDIIPMIPAIYDEPFADSSQIPTYLISKLAREHVTVSLSGDGGDELFCGYERYFDCANAWNKLENRKGIISFLIDRTLQYGSYTVLSHFIRYLLPSQRNNSPEHIVEKLAGLNSIRHSRSFQEYYDKNIRIWLNAEEIVLGSDNPGTILSDFPASHVCKDNYKQMMLLDSMSYLPDDILVKVDRASMANSLETRVPFLNHRVIEHAARIPSSMQTNGTTGKHILRSILYKYVPETLIERPKQGFAIPLKFWLRTHLKDWADELLNADRLRTEEYFDVQTVTRKWREHISGRMDHSAQLWGILVFQSWLDETRSGTSSSTRH